MNRTVFRVATLIVVLGLGLVGMAQAQEPGGKSPNSAEPLRLETSSSKDIIPGQTAVCGVLVTPPAKEGGSVPESISGSTVTPWTGSCYWWDAQTRNVCFQVSNTSSDVEWLDRVQLTFPTNWTVACATQDAADSGGNAISFTCTIAGTTASYTDNDGGYGEIYGNQTWNFCVTVSAPTSATGAQTLNWTLSGDGYGSTPHDISGSTSLSQCGDTCAFAPLFTNLTCNGTTYYNLLGMDQSSGQNDSKSACYTVNNDRWFTWTNSTGEAVNFMAHTDDANNPSGDSELALYEGTSCSGATQQACEDDNGVGRSVLSYATDASVAAGNTVYVRFDGYNGSNAFDYGYFRCCPVSEAAPGNDACGSATTISPSSPSYSVTNVNTCNATLLDSTDPVMDCGSTWIPRQSGSVWYKYTPTSSEAIAINTIGSDYDTVLGIYTGSCGSLTQRACDDDSGGSGTSQILGFQATAGTTYYIMTASYGNRGGRTGGLNFSFSHSPLAVDLAAFTAAAAPDGVTLAWETVAETDNAGFNLSRAGDETGPWTRLNAALIPAAAPGSSAGHSYTWLDATAAPDTPYVYRLEAVALDGSAEILDISSVTYRPQMRRWLPLIGQR